MVGSSRRRGSYRTSPTDCPLGAEKQICTSIRPPRAQSFTLPRHRGDSMRFGFICLVLLVTAAQAADTGKRVKYSPPEGFAGHKWGDLRSSFDRLPETPVGVGAAWMRAHQKQSGFQCIPNVTIGQQQAGAQDFCNFQETLLRLRTDFAGGGMYVLSEYSIDGQGFRFGEGESGVVLHPVIYQFCANWRGSRKKAPPQNFDELNK